MKKISFVCSLAILALSNANAAGAPPPNSGDLFGQPLGERAAQQSLPQSHDTLWATLQHTVITEDTKQGIYTARHPADVKALVGKKLTIQGFMLPYTTDLQIRHFLLTRYTPVCFFCPPGAPNEVIDVKVEQPVKWEDKLYYVTGTFAIENDGEKGLFFRLDNAVIAEPVKLDIQDMSQVSGRDK